MPEITDDPPPLADIVREYIIAVCELCNWRIATAAMMLGLSKKTLYNRLTEYEQAGLIERITVGEWLKRTRWQRRRAA